MKRKFSAVLPLLSLLLLLCGLPALLTGCGRPNDDLPAGSGSASSGDTSKEPVSFETLTRQIDSVFAQADVYAPRDADYLENFLGVSPDDFAACRVLVSTEGGSISEYGVFEVLPEKSPEEAVGTVNAYLDFYRNQLWDDRYTPEEFPKLRDAEVKSFGGRFVVYAILDEAEREAVFAAAAALFS